MVYKYQIETINYLIDLCDRLEKLTEDKMSLKIGYARGNFLSCSGSRYITVSGDLYLTINYNDCFSINESCSGKFTDVDKDSVLYISFDDNIFLKLNEWIDRIYKNKHDREQFHEKLNHELECLNKSLE